MNIDQDGIRPLLTGRRWRAKFYVSNSSIPLKVTLVWTDPPGEIYCDPCLRNDLDLILKRYNAPPTYKGNNFGLDNWSLANGSLLRKRKKVLANA